MNKFGIGSLIIGALLIIMSPGCTFSNAGPHSKCARFQRTRGHRAHVMRDRIYNPNDYRYKHDNHAPRGE